MGGWLNCWLTALALALACSSKTESESEGAVELERTSRGGDGEMDMLHLVASAGVVRSERSQERGRTIVGSADGFRAEPDRSRHFARRSRLSQGDRQVSSAREHSPTQHWNA